MAAVCPYPDKTVYPSKQAAKRGIRGLPKHRADGGPGRLHAYVCPCRSHWHIGHIY